MLHILENVTLFYALFFSSINTLLPLHCIPKLCICFSLSHSLSISITVGIRIWLVTFPWNVCLQGREITSHDIDDVTSLKCHGCLEQRAGIIHCSGCAWQHSSVHTVFWWFKFLPLVLVGIVYLTDFPDCNASEWLVCSCGGVEQ